VAIGQYLTAGGGCLTLFDINKWLFDTICQQAVAIGHYLAKSDCYLPLFDSE